MLKYNLKLFFRNIKKHKSTFLINVIGMSTALASILLVGLWAIDEIKMDKFHEKDDQLFQVMQHMKMGDKTVVSNISPTQTANVMLENLPEVELATSVITTTWFDEGKSIIFNGADYVTGSYRFASNTFFKVFTYPLIHGNEDTVLDNRNSVAISEEMAIKLFGQADHAVGKSIDWVHETFGGVYSITGVFKAPPANSSTQFDVLFPHELFGEFFPHSLDWDNNSTHTYLVLRKGIDIEQFNEKMTKLLKAKHESPFILNDLFVQPYSDQYLYGSFGQVDTARIQYVTLFCLLALFILIIACVNYINLSTAKSTTRAGEIGMQKVLGAKRKTLIGQHITESLLVSSISLIVAMVLVIIVLPQFETISGKTISLQFNPELVLLVTSITFITGLLAGLYPAIILSGFNPIKALKGAVESGIGGRFIRKGLVVFQFTAAIILMVAFAIVYKQIELINSKNLGFDKQHVIAFEMGKKLPDVTGQTNGSDSIARLKQTMAIERFLRAVRDIPGVVSATNFRHNMIGDFGETTGLSWEGNDPENNVVFGNLIAGYDYIETMGIPLKEGRSYSKKFSSENEKIILNEAAIETMGLENPIGKTIMLWGQPREIIGVTKDFHFASLYEEIKPVFFNLDVSSFSSKIMARLEVGNQKSTIERIKKRYGEIFDGQQVSYKFLEDDYNELYNSENRVASLSKYFAMLAIIISCLGLFGLAMFTVQRRKKEISIRKVLGQSATQVTVMLSSEFAKLVLISILIALPIAYLLASNWLSGFAYRIPLQVWYFIGAGLVALVVAMLTVGSQAIRAANKNPVNALRDE